MGMPGLFFQVSPVRDYSPAARAPCHPPHRARVEFPDDITGLGIQSVHPALHALVVAASLADPDHAVPGDRSGGNSLSQGGIGDFRLPELFPVSKS